MTMDEYTNSRYKALENNGCSMCRAMCLPVCQGHEKQNQNKRGERHHATPQSLLDTFSESSLWQYEEGTDDIHRYDSPHALLSIKIDLGAGFLFLTQREQISAEEQKELDKLFKAIEHEAKNSQKQSIECHREISTLTIKISTPESFDEFIQNLTEQNLLITDSSKKKQHNNKIKINITTNNPKNTLKIRGNTASAKNQHHVIQHKKIHLTSIRL